MGASVAVLTIGGATEVTVTTFVEGSWDVNGPEDVAGIAGTVEAATAVVGGAVAVSGSQFELIGCET